MPRRNIIYRSYYDLGVEIRPSTIHGIGVFALTGFKRGAYIGTMNGTILDDFEEYETDYTIGFTDKKGSVWQLEPGEPFKFLNHSDKPNVDIPGSMGPCLYARRNIVCGEELTINYGEGWENMG